MLPFVWLKGMNANAWGSLVVAIITGVVTPYMLNPTAWNWQNYAGFFWVRLTHL